MDLVLVAFIVFGAVLGFAADWLAHRWPSHLATYRRATLDWRTFLLMLTGAAAFGALGRRWPTDTTEVLIYAPLFVAFIVLLATDLDQKLLPDLLTLPLIVAAAALLVLGSSPALADKQLGLISGIAAGILAPLLLFVTDRVLGGDLGAGDLKLSISLGLLFGLSALFYGFLLASVGFAVVLLVLIALRRLSLRSAVPFGPVLIFGAFIAALLA